MPEITFIADPGADDILVDGVSLNNIDAFRTECLSGGAVSCDWDTLHTRLINHDVSRFWWFLTETERRSIAMMAIGNTLTKVYRYGRSGKPNCEGGEGDFGEIACLNNAVIRYIKFTSNTFGVVDTCYYSEYRDSDEFCYVPEQSFGLRGYIVTCTGPSYGHSMCAVQIERDITTLDSLVVFQYGSFDIKPGHWQMPKETHISIHEPTTSMKCNGYSAKIIAEFDI